MFSQVWQTGCTKNSCTVLSNMGYSPWVFICRSQQKDLLAPSCSPGQVWHITGARTVPGTVPGGPRPDWHSSALSLGLLQLPVLFESLLWLPVSASPSSSPGWFYTSVVTREPRGGSFELGSWRQLSQAKALPFCLFASGYSLSLTAQ